MQNLAVIGLSVLLGLKDFFATKQGKKIQVALIAVVLYFLVQSFIKNAQKQNTLDNAPDNAASSFAIRLHDALNPSGVEWLNSFFGDGTNENEVLQVAAEMKPLQNFSEVSAKYRTLYSSDLATDLEKDGVFKDFKANYQKTATGGSTTAKPFSVGQQLKFTASNWNIRALNYPHKPFAQTTSGAIAGTVLYSNPLTLTVLNNNGTTVKDTFIALKNAAGKTYIVSKQILQ